MRRSQRSRDIRRSCIEIFDRGLVKRSCRELLYRDLGGPGIPGDLRELLYRDLS